MVNFQCWFQTLYCLFFTNEIVYFSPKKWNKKLQVKIKEKGFISELPTQLKLFHVSQVIQITFHEEVSYSVLILNVLFNPRILETKLWCKYVYSNNIAFYQIKKKICFNTNQPSKKNSWSNYLFNVGLFHICSWSSSRDWKKPWNFTVRSCIRK